MDSMKTLLDAGAEVIAGTVNLNHVELGRLRDGDLHLNDEGRAKLQELTAEDEKPAGKPVAKKAAAKKAKDEPKGEAPADSDPGDSIDNVDDLLKDLDV